MKRSHAKYFLFVLFLASFPVLGLSQPAVKVVGGFNQDFGTAYTNEPMQKDITVLNKGKDTLIITGVSTACGCTVGKMNPDRIPANGKGMLHVTFDPERFTGKVNKSVSFETNDPNQAHVHIDFTVDVEKILSIDQEYVAFAGAMVDSVATTPLVIKNTSTNPVKILSVISTSPLLYVTPEKAEIQPNEEATFNCMLRAKAKGIVKGNILIDTDSRLLPKINRRFFALVKAAK